MAALEQPPSVEAWLAQLRSEMGRQGGLARAKALTKAERRAAASHAARAPRKKRKREAA